MTDSIRRRIDRIEQQATQPSSRDFAAEGELLELMIADAEARELAEQLCDRQFAIGDHASEDDPIVRSLADRFERRMEQLKQSSQRSSGANIEPPRCRE